MTLNNETAIIKDLEDDVEQLLSHVSSKLGWLKSEDSDYSKTLKSLSDSVKHEKKKKHVSSTHRKKSNKSSKSCRKRYPNTDEVSSTGDEGLCQELFPSTFTDESKLKTRKKGTKARENVFSGPKESISREETALGYHKRIPFVEITTNLPEESGIHSQNEDIGSVCKTLKELNIKDGVSEPLPPSDCISSCEKPISVVLHSPVELRSIPKPQETATETVEDHLNYTSQNAASLCNTESKQNCFTDEFVENQTEGSIQTEECSNKLTETKTQDEDSDFSCKFSETNEPIRWLLTPPKSESNQGKTLTTVQAHYDVQGDPPHVTSDMRHSKDDTPPVIVMVDKSHMAGDTPHVTDNTLHVARDVPHVTDDTPHVTDDTPHVTDDMPFVADDTPCVTDDKLLVKNNTSRAMNDIPLATNDKPQMKDDTPRRIKDELADKVFKKSTSPNRTLFRDSVNDHIVDGGGDRPHPRREQISDREKSQSSSEESDDAFESFITSMKTPKKPSKEISMADDDFIDDGPIEGGTISDGEEEALFYLRLENDQEQTAMWQEEKIEVLGLPSLASEPDMNSSPPQQTGTPESPTQSKAHPNIGKKTVHEVVVLSSSDEDDDVFVTPRSTKKTGKRIVTLSTPMRTPATPATKKKGSFLSSLSTPVRGTPSSSEYVSDFKKKREELTRKLFVLYNETVFENKLPSDMEVQWNKRMRKTAGCCVYSKSSLTRNVRIELSEKVCDLAERLRDTLIHEMCHAACWLINGVNDGHGRFWKYWAYKANSVHPDLPVIKRCHSYEINTKYKYQCQRCKAIIGRHSKSIDTTKKCCGYCTGQLILLSSSSKDGSVSTPRTPNKFALYVKENYAIVKKTNSSYKHGDVMRVLSQEFARKTSIT